MLAIYLYFALGTLGYYLVGSVTAAVHNKYTDLYGKDISVVFGVFWPIMIPLGLLMQGGGRLLDSKPFISFIKSSCIPYKFVRKQLDRKKQAPQKKLPKMVARELKQ
jgi:hypothetical protein